jgi:hypothetical protein
MDMLRIRDGKIAEGWVSWDVLALVEQLAAPAPPASADTVGESSFAAGFLSLLERLRP